MPLVCSCFQIAGELYKIIARLMASSKVPGLASLKTMPVAVLLAIVSGKVSTTVSAKPPVFLTTGNGAIALAVHLVQAAGFKS